MTAMEAGGPVPAKMIDAQVSAAQTAAEAATDAQRGFSRSILISAVRCTLTYIVLPLVTPFIGLAPGVGPTLGLALGTVAIAANVFSIRRFWRSDHHWKVQATVLHAAVLLLLAVLMFQDLRQLFG